MGGTNGIKCTLALSVIFLWGCDKVMTQLGTTLRHHVADPAVMWLRVGDLQYAEVRMVRLNHGGGVPLGLGGTLDYEGAWLQQDGRAWTASFSIDPARLTTHEGAGKRGQIEITLGPGADVTVTTAHPELLKKRGVPPPSGDYADLIPITLLETCGTPLPDDDPRMSVLESGWDLDYAVTPALARRDEFLAQNPAPLSRCDG